MNGIVASKSGVDKKPTRRRSIDAEDLLNRTNRALNAEVRKNDALKERRAKATEAATAGFPWQATLKKLGLEALGVDDFKKCVFEGSLSGCAWTALNVVGGAVTKIGKFGKAVAKGFTLYNDFSKTLKTARRVFRGLDNSLDESNAALKALNARRASEIKDVAAAKRAASKAKEAGSSASRGGDVDPRQIKFGQKRAGPRFSQKDDVPDVIKGRPLDDVASDLRSGRLSPDTLQISVFEHEGELISANTRGLAALSMAGMRPTNIKRIDSSPDSRRRLNEAPLPGYEKLPSTSIRIPPSINDKTVLRTVTIPGAM